jgi:hypothetical protein
LFDANADLKVRLGEVDLLSEGKALYPSYELNVVYLVDHLDHRTWGTMTKPIQGYVRADVPLNVLETTVERFSTNPLAGVLEISTEDGVLRLAIRGTPRKTCG